MASEAPKIVIEWAEMHEPTDGPGTIVQHLGAGHDEGPLLVVLAAGSRNPRRAEGRIFADVTSYEKHLLQYDDDVRSDRTGILSAPRWTALVRHRSGDDKADAFAAVYALKLLLAPSSSTVSYPRRARLRSAQDYQVLECPYHAEHDVQIENTGDGFPDVRRVFPALTTSMVCSPDGLLTALPDWDEEDEWK